MRYITPYHNEKVCNVCEVSDVSYIVVNTTVSVPSVLTNENRYLAKLNIESAIFGMHKVNMHTPFNLIIFTQEQLVP